MNSLLKKTLVGFLILILTLTVTGCEILIRPMTTTATAPISTSESDTTSVPSETTTTPETTEPPSETTSVPTIAPTTAPTTPTIPTTIPTTATTTPITSATTPITTTTPLVVSLEVTPPTKLSYDVNDPLDLSGLVVILRTGTISETLNSTQYSVSMIDMSTEGTKTVLVTYMDLADSFSITVGSVFEITMPYYLSASGLTGQSLLLELRDIINTGFDGVSYGDSRYLLDDTDADPTRSGYVILIYNGASVSGVWDEGATWNREHVWPQSLLGVEAKNTLTNAASDLQNLKPCNPSINSSRNNKYYDVATTAVSYFPRLEDRGDIARILLYMVVMYDEYTLVDTTPSTYQMAKLSVLLQWCEDDPVDDFERHRNDMIFSYQYNRNPFIDYPEFVDMIWG